jgi:hypothetical protein
MPFLPLQSTGMFSQNLSRKNTNPSEFRNSLKNARVGQPRFDPGKDDGLVNEREDLSESQAGFLHIRE